MKRFKWLSRRGARLAFGVLAGALLCAAAALAILRVWVLDEVKVRDEIIAALHAATDMDVQLAGVELHFWPRPHLSLRTLEMTGNGAQLDVDEISGTLPWLSLMRGELIISSAAVLRPQLRFEAFSHAAECYRAMDQRLKAGAGAAPGPAWQVHELDVRDLSVLVAGDPVATGDLQVTGLREPESGLRFSAALPRAGAEAMSSGDLTLSTAPEGRVLSGELRVESLDSATLVGVAAGESWQGSARARLTQTPLDSPEASIEGALQQQDQALAFESLVWWQDGKLGASEIVLSGENVKGEADATVDFQKGVAVQLHRLVVAGERLERLLRLTPAQVRLSAPADARLTITDTLLGVETGHLRVVEGRAFSEGLDLAVAGVAGRLPGIRGEITAKENLFDVSLNAEGLSITGSLAPDFAAQRVVVRAAGQAAAARVAALLPGTQLSEPAGMIELTDLAGDFSWAGQAPRDLSATAYLNGLGLSFQPDSQKAPVQFAGITGVVRYEGGVFRLEHLEGEGLNISGSVTPDWAARQFAVALAGTVDLGTGLVQPWLPAQGVKDIQGRLTCTELSGLIGGGGLPSDLKIAGTLEHTAATVILGDREDRWTEIAARFETTAGGVSGDATIHSERMGNVTLTGDYHPAAFEWDGTVQASLTRVLGVWLSGRTGEYAQALARGMGVVSARFKATLPSPAAREFKLEGEQTAGGNLRLALLLREQGGQWRTDSLRVTGAVALDDTKDVFPLGIDATGAGLIDIEKVGGSPSFVVRADLASATLKAGAYLQKDAGIPMTFQIEGAVDAGGWSPGGAEIVCAGQHLRLQPRGGGWQCSDLELALAPLTPLFRGKESATGTVSGTFSTTPARANLSLRDVAFALTPEVQVQSSGGNLTFQDSVWRVDGLHFAGGKNDFVLSGEFGDAGWAGRMEGASLNLDALMTMPQTLQGSGQSEAQAPPAGRRALTADIQKVYFRRAELEDVHAEVSLAGNELLVDKLHFRPHTGSVDGTVRSVSGDNGARRMAVNLRFDGADLRVFEEILLAEPRNMAGLMSGSAQLEFLSGQGLDILNTLDGTLKFTASNGTYGTLGWATKMISVLKTTELIRLHLPSMKDTGLSFVESEVDLGFSAGTMQIRKFVAADRAYSMEGEGLVDFPANNSAAEFRVYLLESVTGLLGGVPVLRSTVNLFKKVSGLRLSVSGSPFDPVVRPDTFLLPDRQPPAPAPPQG